MRIAVALGGALCAWSLLGAPASAQTGFTPGNVCAAVEAQTEELEPRHRTVFYQYQTLIYDEAGVRPTDDEETVNRKVRELLNARMPQLLCDQFNFSPKFGNLLKLAVDSQAEPFINDALRQWHIDLNQVDAVDGRTVLDFIVLRKTEAGSNANLQRIWQRYYDRFRAAGAKHASELRGG